MEWSHSLFVFFVVVFFLTLEDKVQAVEELARITAVLHEKNLSHRDLKPSNAMVEEGRCEALKLLDLGQARSEGDRDLTRPEFSSAPRATVHPTSWTTSTIPHSSGRTRSAGTSIPWR